MNLELKPLINALKLASHSLLSNDFIPILSHFCFDDEVLYAFNDVSAVLVEHKTGLSCALRGDTLLGLLEAGSGEKVEVKHLKEVVDIAAGNSKIKMPALSDEEFIFKLPTEEASVKLPFTDDVVSAFKSCLITVGQDALRPEFTALTARLSKTFVLYSSDNATISRYQGEKVLGRKETTVIIPKSTAQQALDLYALLVTGDKQKPELRIGDKFLEIDFDSDPETHIYSKLLAAEPADFEKTIQSHLKKATLFDIPEAFPQAIKRAEILLAKDLDQRCEISTTAKVLRVQVKGALGEMSEEMKAAGGSVRNVTVNPAHVSRVLSYCKQIGISEQGALVMVGDRYTGLIESNAAVAGEDAVA